jgi:undecaprenyl-diphosphatase
MVVASMLGSEILTALVVVGLIGLAWRRRWRAAAILLVVAVGAQLTNDVLKGLFQRARPSIYEALFPVQVYSFPSGHATMAAAVYGLAIYAVWRSLRGWRRSVGTAGLLALVLLIGLSRVYLGLHYPSDVLGGYSAGAAWAAAVVLGDRALAGRRSRAGGASDPGEPSAPAGADSIGAA